MQQQEQQPERETPSTSTSPVNTLPRVVTTGSTSSSAASPASTSRPQPQLQRSPSAATATPSSATSMGLPVSLQVRRKGIAVSYCDDFNIWPHVAPLLHAQFPLRNVEWRTTSTSATSTGVGSSSSTSTADGPSATTVIGASGRLLAALHVDLQKFVADVPKYHPLLQIRYLPYMHLYLTCCEDVEVYKQVVKKQIKQWIDAINVRRNQEWLIVHVFQNSAGKPGGGSGSSSSGGSSAPTSGGSSSSTSAAAAAGNKLLKQASISVGGGGVLERIRNDFNTGKRDRVATIRLGEELTPASPHDPDAPATSEAWRDLLAKLVDGMSSSYGMVIAQMQDDIRKMEVERLTPGFNYFNFFMVKESVALSYESLDLLEEALLQFDELEAVFLDCVDSAVQKDMKMWSGNFGGSDSMDDSASILSVEKKLYQELIATNAISIFDFRTYLFARQCHLLLCLERPIDMLIRAKMVIAQITRGIVERQQQKHNDAETGTAPLIPYFLESWVFSACSDVVNQCEKLLPSVAGQSGAAKYEKLKGELVFQARRQLDKLGVAFGYIYPGDPTQFTLMPDATHHSSVPAITNQTLLKALASATAFDELYISYSEKALKCLYAASGLRTVRLIRCDIASIHFNRGRWQQAYDIFRDMLQLDDADAAVDDPAQRPSIDAWTAIDLDILMKLARCLKEMGVAYAQEYRRMCGLLVLLHDRLTVEQVKYYTALLEEATSDSLPANESDASVEIDMARLCTVQLLQQNPGSDDFFTYDDGRVIQARVMFGSPVPMRVHSAELLMYGKHGQEVSFSSCVSDDSVASTTATMGVVLSPGANLFRMQCPSDVPAGQYVAGKFLLHMSAGTGVDFAQSYLHPSTPKQLFTVRESEQCLKISVTSATTATVELKRDAEFGGWGAKGAAGWTAPRFSPLAVPNESVVLRLYTRDNSIAENSELSFASNTGLVVSDGQTCTVSVYREPSHTSLADLSHGANGEEGCVADQKSTIKEVAIKDDKLRLPIVIPKHCIVEILIEVEDRKWNTAFAAWDSAGEGEAVNERRHDLTVSYDFVNEFGRRHLSSSTHSVSTTMALTCEQHIVYHEEKILLQLTVKSRTADLPVRLLDFTLQLPEGLQLQSAALPPLNAVIFPQQSANFVYELALGVAGDADDVPVSFALSYRTLDHELYASIRRSLIAIAKEYSATTTATSLDTASSSESLASVSSLSTFTAARYIPFLARFLYTHSLPNSKARRRVFNFYAMMDRVRLVPPPPWMQVSTAHGTPSEADMLDVMGQSNLERRLVQQLGIGANAKPVTESTAHKRRAKLLQTLAEIVKEFYAVNHAVIEATTASSADLAAATMTINFQLHVPVCDVLTIVELKPLSQDSIVVGEPVPCRLRCRQVAFGDQHLSTPSRLIIDLDLNHDHWLCAGRKRRTVDLKPGGDGATFDDVHLLPKKTGLLLLPEVHVRRIPATVLEDTRATIAEVQRLPSVRHQYFYRNGGEQVMVHPQQQSNFFWLPAHETEGATATSGPSIVAGAGTSHAPFLSPDTGRSTTQWSLDLTSPPTTAPIASGYLRTNLPSNLAFLINNPTGGTPITRATSFTATSTSGTASPGKESKFGGLLSRVAKRVGATSSGARATYSPMSEMSLDERL